MFALLAQTTVLFDKHEHTYTAKNHEADNEFCACPQIYGVRHPSSPPAQPIPAGCAMRHMREASAAACVPGGSRCVCNGAVGRTAAPC